jgi:hypothetical protein
MFEALAGPKWIGHVCRFFIWELIWELKNQAD